MRWSFFLLFSLNKYIVLVKSWYSLVLIMSLVQSAPSWLQHYNKHKHGPTCRNWALYYLKMPSAWAPPRASTYWESWTCTQGSFLSGKSSLCLSITSSSELPNREGVTMARLLWSISSRVGLRRPWWGWEEREDDVTCLACWGRDYAVSSCRDSCHQCDWFQRLCLWLRVSKCLWSSPLADESERSHNSNWLMGLK